MRLKNLKVVRIWTVDLEFLSATDLVIVILHFFVGDR